MENEILFKRIHPNVRLPEKHGAAWDLFLPESIEVEIGETAIIPLGFACKLPENCYALVMPRSSTFGKWGLFQTNGIGLIDNAYCGNEDEWKWSVYRCGKFTWNGEKRMGVGDMTIPAGTRLAQFIIIHNARDYQFKVVDNLPDANRGGFGSTGA